MHHEAHRSPEPHALLCNCLGEHALKSTGRKFSVSFYGQRVDRKSFETKLDGRFESTLMLVFVTCPEEQL